MTTKHYTDKFMQLVKAAQPDMTDMHVPALLKSARGYAGAMAKKDISQRMSCHHEFGDDGVCPMCGAKSPAKLSEWGKTHRLFVELGKDGLTDWVQITPGPGTWNSPRYGAVVITDDTLQHYVENFANKVYQEHIPVDAEHKTKLSGALAYYREMKVGGPKDEPGVWAKLELTDRGQELLDGDGFKYFSPEFYDEWEDPASGKVYTDVITGGAFTTKPFFKDRSMMPVRMCDMMPYEDPEEDFEEDTGDLAEMIADMVSDGLTDDEITSAVGAVLSYTRQMQAAYNRANGVMMSDQSTGDAPEKNASQPISDNQKTGGNDDMTDEATTVDIKTFAEEKTKREELEAQVKAMSEERQQLADESKKLSERIASMEDDAQTKRFTEVATGRGGANDGGRQWFGDAAKHVGLLKTLAKTFGEDSTEVTDYIAHENQVAEALATSGAMTELGSTSPAPGGNTAEEKIQALAKEMSEREHISIEQAQVRVMAENPKLYSEAENSKKGA